MNAAMASMDTVVDTMRGESGLRGELRINEPMARHVSWRAGGTVDRAYFPADLGDLQRFLRTLPPDEPLCFVGLGSNLLVRDGGLRGTAIFTHRALRTLRLSADGSGICAEAGVPSPKLARFAALHDLTGAEFLAGIPGTIGGALAMNAGCYGGETWAIVSEVRTVDRRGELRSRSRSEYEIGYRTVYLRPAAGSGEPSACASAEEWFVEATFRLPRGEGQAARRRIKELLERRIATQPLNLPNAGSVFRNPKGDFAARFIEACGLKGYRIGDAQISPMHANFIVNVGRARAADIEALIDLAQDAVKARFGIALEREVRIVGEV